MEICRSAPDITGGTKAIDEANRQVTYTCNTTYSFIDTTTNKLFDCDCTQDYSTVENCIGKSYQFIIIIDTDIITSTGIGTQ